MIDHIWTIFCSRAVVDQRSNNLSIQNIIEQITVGEEPPPEAAVPLMCEVVTLWARGEDGQPDEGRGRIRYVSPAGNELLTAQIQIDLTGVQRFRTVTSLQSLPVEGTGTHTFHVDLEDNGEWREVAAVPLVISVRPPDTTESDE